MDKNNLIQTWMARALLNASRGRNLQTGDAAIELFYLLIQRSLLQTLQKANRTTLQVARCITLCMILHCKYQQIIALVWRMEWK